MFTGDECLAGRNPLQGTELCAVVEFMYSLEHLFSVFGNTAFADRLERVAFNALPATFTPDMWAHQYDQQVNQVQCTINPDHGWSTNGPESNLYGLEPTFGCCTSNIHPGWPKLVAHLWMKTPDEGLVAASWAPCRVETKLREVPVTVEVDTDYPFRDTVSLRVTTARSVRAPLLLRVPAWAAGASVRVGAGAEAPMKSGDIHRLEREWTGTTQVTLRFPMRAKITVRYNEAIAVERGPLVYALKIGEQWTRVNADKPHRELPHADFEVRPATPWNYGLVLDETKPDAGLRFRSAPSAKLSPGANDHSCRAQNPQLEDRARPARSPADVAWSDPSRNPTESPTKRSHSSAAPTSASPSSAGEGEWGAAFRRVRTRRPDRRRTQRALLSEGAECRRPRRSGNCHVAPTRSWVGTRRPDCADGNPNPSRRWRNRGCARSPRRQCPKRTPDQSLERASGRNLDEFALAVRGEGQAGPDVVARQVREI